MKKPEENKIIAAGVTAAEMLASLNTYGTLYESVCEYLFLQLKGYLYQLQLYVLDENQKVLKEEVICSDKGAVQGEDIIPLYQLPKIVEREGSAVQIREKHSYSLFIPLNLNRKILGLLLFKNNKPWDAFVPYFENMGKAIAIGIQQMIFSNSDHRYKSFFNKTVEIANIFHTVSTMEQLVITFAKQAVQLLNFDRITVFVKDYSEREMALCYCVTSCGRETFINKIPQLPEQIREPLPINRKTGYWFPLLTNARKVGLVLFDNLYSQYSIPDSYLHMLTPLCNQFAASIDNIRLFQDVQRAAQKDRLTDLYNRAYFEAQQAQLDTEAHYPLSIIVGDVNGLKITNDIFGHFEGDIVLQAIADIMKGVCRKNDIIARWGGDEYIILLPNTSEKRAESMVREVKRRCKRTKNTRIQLSISMGWATKKFADEEIEQIMKKAEERMYRNKLLERTYFRNTFIATMREMLHKRCQEPAEHIDRMDYLSGLLGKFMHLSDNDRDELKLLAMLHDIGKVAIRHEVLNKSGTLDKNEWAEIRKHSEAGYRIAQASPELSRIAAFILFHHERWDGKGYPMGKKGLEIPLLSRIISVIDAYDVMTHHRVYKKAMSHEKALEELKRCSGTQFDPDIVDQFIHMQETLLSADKQ